MAESRETQMLRLVIEIAESAMGVVRDFAMESDPAIRQRMASDHFARIEEKIAPVRHTLKALKAGAAVANKALRRDR